MFCECAANPAKTNLQDHARFLQDCARILHARLAWHVHAICLFSCTILAQSCTYLARSCTNLARNSAEMLQELPASLDFFCKILQELVQDCARIVQESCKKRDISRARLACKILARILHDLASSFLLGRQGSQSGADTITHIAAVAFTNLKISLI